MSVNSNLTATPNSGASRKSSLQEMRAACFWIAILAVNFYMPFPLTSIDYFFIDTGEAVYTTKLIALGRVPYRDIFSHHFFGYLLPFFLVEKLVGITPTSVWALAVLFNFINSVLVFHILYHLCGRRAAHWGALFSATAGWFPNWQGYVFNVQSTVLPYIYLFVLCAIRITLKATSLKCLALGILYGWLVSADIRNAAFGFVAAPVFVSNFRINLRSVSFFAIGASVLPAAALLYLSINGALAEFIFQTVIFPFSYRNVGSLKPEDGYMQFLLLKIPAHLNEFLFALAGTLILLSLKWPLKLKFAVISLFVSAVLASMMGGRGFVNYLLYFSPWIVLSVSILAYDAVPVNFFRHFGPWLIGLLCAVSVLSGPVHTQMRVGQLRVAFDPHENGRRAANYIKKRTVRESAVFIWGYYPQLYLFSERFSRWRVLEQLPLTGGNYDSTKFSTQGIVPGIIKEFRKCLRERPPEFIVTYQKRRRSFPRRNCVALGDSQINGEFERRRHLKYFKNFVDAHYRLVQSLSSVCDRIRIFKLSPHSPYKPKRDHLKNVCSQEELLKFGKARRDFVEEN